jgi:hypothetical protein
MNIKKSALIAGVAAALFEGVLWWFVTSFGHIGGDGPDAIWAIGLITHFPGIMVADSLHLTGTTDSVLVAASGFVQFFILFWIIITIGSRIYARRAAERTRHSIGRSGA